ncbi:MAG: DivIVA domain-containing protein [Actinomycetota bacterium]
MPLQSDKLRLLRRIPDIRFEEENRGYSKDQVDRVLANLAPLADEIERLQARLSEAETRAASAEARLVEARSPSQSSMADGMPPAPQPDFDETLRNTLVSAQRQADMTVREAKEEAERLRTEAEFQSNAMLADARDQSAEMTTEAVAYRERLMAEAAAERSKMLDEARDEAKERVQAVERELADAHEAERSALISQITELQGTHKLLQDDVGRFEQHLKQRAAQVRAALEDITQVLDDPERLRSHDGLEPAAIDDLDAEAYPPIAVEVVALNDLESEAEAAASAVAQPGDVIDAAELDELAPDPTGQGDGDYDDGDPELGVQTQTISPPPLEDAPLGPDDETQPPAPANGDGDPFLDELRRVTNEDPSSDDPISDFLDDDKRDRGAGGWFGRRR